MTEKKKTIDCYVVVTGWASNDEDEGVQGIYLIQVSGASFKPEQPFYGLDRAEVSDLTDAVLTQFHDHQGIEDLDDFEISVHLADGTQIEEFDEPSASGAKFVAEYWGQANIDNLPPEIAALMDSNPLIEMNADKLYTVVKNMLACLAANDMDSLSNAANEAQALIDEIDSDEVVEVDADDLTTPKG